MGASDKNAPILLKFSVKNEKRPGALSRGVHREPFKSLFVDLLSSGFSGLGLRFALEFPTDFVALGSGAGLADRTINRALV